MTKLRRKLLCLANKFTKNKYKIQCKNSKQKQIQNSGEKQIVGFFLKNKRFKLKSRKISGHYQKERDNTYTITEQRDNNRNYCPAKCQLV